MAQNVTLVRPDGNEPRDVVDFDAGDDLDFDVAFEMPRRAPPASAVPPPPQWPQQPRQMPQPQPQRRPQPRPPPQQTPLPPPQPEELNDFANKNKIDDSLEMEQSPGEFEQDFNEQEDFQDDDDLGPQQYRPVEIEPLPPFETLEDERADLMFKLQRSARNGIQTRPFGYNADIRELRSEVARAKAEHDVNASIAFQRQILMTICSGLEFANRKFSYMDLELDGWSESMMDDIGKYDNVFEKLHAKHASRMSIPPEIQLIMMIGGSAMTWHLTKTMMGGGKKAIEKTKPKRRRARSPSSSESEDESEASESEDDESPRERERRMYSRAAPPPKKKRPGRPRPGRRAKSPQRRQGQNQRREPVEMRGPGFDVGSMMGLGGLAGSILPQVPVPDLAPRFTRDKPAQKRPVIEELPSTRSEAEAEAEAPSAAPSDSGSERLSDIPSDLDDVPSDLDVPSDADGPGPQPKNNPKNNQTKVIEFSDAPKKRGRPSKKAEPKNVIVI